MPTYISINSIAHSNYCKNTLLDKFPMVKYYRPLKNIMGCKKSLLYEGVSYSGADIELDPNSTKEYLYVPLVDLFLPRKAFKLAMVNGVDIEELEKRVPKNDPK